MIERRKLEKLAVRTKIKAAGTSQRQIAARLYCTSAAVGYWCRGLHRAAMSDIEIIADILGCETEDIILKEERQ